MIKDGLKNRDLQRIRTRFMAQQMFFLNILSAWRGCTGPFLFEEMEMRFADTGESTERNKSMIDLNLIYMMGKGARRST